MRTARFAAAALAASFLASAGCQSNGQTGALVGAGIGALAGQAIGGDTGATLIGAAVGSGVGYVIGNEEDKKKAQQMSRDTSHRDYAHDEINPLAGSRWQLVSISPRDAIGEYVSKVCEFKSNGRVTSTTTLPSGRVEIEDERYRVVGDTLIINQDDYIVNARFSVDNDQLVLSSDDFSAVLERVR